MRRRLFLLLPALLVSLRAADAPVPVVQEPCHRIVFENDYVRISDVQVPAGATTLYHVHTIPSAIVYLTKSSPASQPWGEAGATPRQTTPGDSRYANYDTKPLTHRVTNTGTNLFHVFDIELLHRPAATAFAASPAAVKVQWEENLLRSSRLVLPAGDRVELPASDCARLLIAIAGSVTTSVTSRDERTVKPQEYAFFEPRARVSLRNAAGGPGDVEAVLLELR